MVLVLYFNSIKVRLKLVNHDMSQSRFCYFNSIKVRLKHLLEYDQKQRCTFQFHKGTIKTCCSSAHLLYLRDFNSIKVRLKRISKFINKDTVIFQFHKGTIKT